MNFLPKKFKALGYLLIGLTIVWSLSNFFISPAKAAFTQIYYRPDRMTAATAPSGSVCAKTATAGSETSMTIIFPSTYTIDTTLNTWNLDTTATNIPTGSTQWPTTTSGNATAANNGTKAVTWTVGDLSSTSTLYCLHFTATGTSVSGSAADNLTGTIATNIDSALSYAVSLVASGADLVTVSATVPTTFSFALGSNAAALGTLSTSAVTSATGITATISTNARLGWSAWVKNTGLTSTAASASVAAPGSYGSTFDLSSVTGYGLDVNAGSGTPTVDSAYDGTADTNFVGVLQTAFKPIATKSTPGASDTVTLRFRAKIASTQAAATDYSDTVTVVAAGNF
jgi:hypothetical protein